MWRISNCTTSDIALFLRYKIIIVQHLVTRPTLRSEATHSRKHLAEGTT